MRELTAALEDSSDELAANQIRWSLVTIATWRGEDVGAEVARLVAWGSSLDDSQSQVAVSELRAQMAFAKGDGQTASDEWMTFAASDALNAPPAYFMAGLAGLMARDAERASAALAAHEATERNVRLFRLDRRLLRAGLVGLGGARPEAVHEARIITTEYGRSGLPWRQALGTLILACVVGDVEGEVGEMVDVAREIFQRLGAAPFLERLDTISAVSHPAVPPSMDTGRPRPTIEVSP